MNTPPLPFYNYQLRVQMLFFAGITLSSFLFLLLFLKKQKSSSDNILAGWLALITVHQSLFYLDYSGISMRFPHLLGLVFPLPLLHGIFLFFYVSSMTNEKPIRAKSVLPHLAAVFLLVFLAVPFYALPAAEKVKVFENAGRGFEWYSIAKIILIVVLGLFYVVWSLILIRRHRVKMEQAFSNTDKKNLKWLEYISISLGAIWLLALFFDDTVIFSGVVALVLFIGFFGINQLPVFNSNFVNETAGETPAEALFVVEKATLKQVAEPVRYAKSGLKTEEANQVYAQLCGLMEKEFLYKNNELALTDLAKKLKIHPNYLSQIINEREQKNFYHYINTLRIEEFIRLASLPENKHFTLIALAYDCGFNSKSTFNKYFKSQTGKTPSEFFGDIND